MAEGTRLSTNPSTHCHTQGITPWCHLLVSWSANSGFVASDLEKELAWIGLGALTVHEFAAFERPTGI